MKRHWVRLVGIALIGTIAAFICAGSGSTSTYPHFSAVVAQTPGSTETASPTVASPTPGSAPAVPQIPILAPTPQPPAQPASSAPPLPLQTPLYQDPGGRFKVGVLQGYNVSPLAGSVLIESPSGNLAYTVVAQAQPMTAPIGTRFQSEGDRDRLAQAAIAVFQRGEGFQPGPPRPEAGGGIVMDWSGSLTIGGQSQPMGGVILVRPNDRSIVMTLIAATQSGASQVPGATTAIANSLEAL